MPRPFLDVTQVIAYDGLCGLQKYILSSQFGCTFCLRPCFGLFSRWKDTPLFGKKKKKNAPFFFFFFF